MMCGLDRYEGCCWAQGGVGIESDPTTDHRHDSDSPVSSPLQQFVGRAPRPAGLKWRSRNKQMRTLLIRVGGLR